MYYTVNFISAHAYSRLSCTAERIYASVVVIPRLHSNGISFFKSSWSRF